jgi:hypothetical protein
MKFFHEPTLAFSVAVPEHWNLLPPAWSPVEQMKRFRGPDDLLAFAAKPFCCAMAHHDSPRHAYPTLQATVRPFARPDNTLAARLLAANVEFLGRQWQGFELLEASSDVIVAGHRANVIRAHFMMPAQPEDTLIELGVLGRVYTVFALGRAYTLGLSGSDDPAWYDERKFDAILASVRIGVDRSGG